MYNYKLHRYLLEKDRIYNTSHKKRVRESLIDKFILPKLKKGKEVSVLDFFGTGLFAKQLINKLEDQLTSVNNHGFRVNLYEIEEDKKLHKYMKGFVDHSLVVKNPRLNVNIIPFYGSLAEFVQVSTVKNQSNTDLIWLDYCGTIISLQEDLKIIKPLVNNDTVIAVTLFESRDALNKEGRIDLCDKYINNDYPLFKRMNHLSYKKMGLFIYKIPSYIKKLQEPSSVCEEPFGVCKEVSYEKTIKIPSSRSLGLFG